MSGYCAPSVQNEFSMLYMCVSSQQNEENKRKNKQAALKAQMDLEEARKTASELQNNHSLQEQEGEKHRFNMKKKT